MEFARAWVDDGLRQTEYVRAGAGHTVVLLSNPAGETAAAAIFRELARTCRVIRPVLNVDLDDFPTWFSGFLDALGLGHTSLLALDGYALAALHFALADDRIERVALVRPGGAPGANGQNTSAVSNVTGRSGPPVLVVPGGEDNGAPEHFEAFSAFFC